MVVAAVVVLSLFGDTPRLVGELNDPDPAVREAAADGLLDRGPAAEAALRVAARDRRPAVRTVAGRLLRRVELGLRPGLPEPTAEEALAFAEAAGGRRVQLAKRLVHRPGGAAIVVDALLREFDPVLSGTLANHWPEGLRFLLIDGREAEALDLLARAADVGADGAEQAHVLLAWQTGSAQRRLTDPAAELRLARLDGDATAMRAAAEKLWAAGRPEAALAGWATAGDWAAVRDAARAAREGRTPPWPRASLRLIEAYAAAEVGDREAARAALVELGADARRQRLSPLEPIEVAAMTDLLGHPDVVEALGGGTGSAVDSVLIEGRVAEARLEGDFAAVARLAARPEAGPMTILEAAGLRGELGEAATARAIWDEVAGRLSVETLDATRRRTALVSLLEIDGEAGLARWVAGDEAGAAERAAAAAGVVQAADATLAGEAGRYWSRLREAHPDEDAGATWDRLTALLTGAADDEAVRRVAGGDDAYLLRRYGLLDDALAVEDDGTADALVERGHAHAAAGDWDAAAAAFGRAARRWPAGETNEAEAAAVALALAAKAHEQAGDAAAAEFAARAARLVPLDGSRDRVMDALAADPSHWQGWQADPEALRRHLALSKATAGWDTVRWVYDHTRSSVLAEADGDAAAASAALSAGLSTLALGPNGPLAYHATGRVRRRHLAALTLFEAGDELAASLAARDAVERTPMMPDLAIGWINRLPPDEGDDLYASVKTAGVSALEEHPESAMLLNRLAWLAARTGRDLEQAEAWSRRSLELRPGQANYEDTLAEILLRTGRADEALALFDTLVERQPFVDLHRERRAEARAWLAENPK